MNAVIDLGTNTFHLLIATVAADGGIRQAYRERRFIKLAEAGIERIGAAPYQRGLDAMEAFAAKMREFGVSNYRAIGTAALRSATNGADFMAEVKAKYSLDISLVDGDEEARLIARGVRMTLPDLAHSRGLIMDIGGGSVEFIIVDQGITRFARSFPVGVALLRNEFHRQEPIATAELNKLHAYLAEQLKPLATILADYKNIHLIGAAGIFEVVAGQLTAAEQATGNTLAKSIDLNQLYAYHQRCRPATLQERLAMPDVPKDRADMMVVALELIQFVLQLSGANQLTASAYAMKEGVLAEMAQP